MRLCLCVQTRQQDLWQQQNQASRLEQLELQLQALAANTEVRHNPEQTFLQRSHRV